MQIQKASPVPLHLSSGDEAVDAARAFTNRRYFHAASGGRGWRMPKGYGSKRKFPRNVKRAGYWGDPVGNQLVTLVMIAKHGGHNVV